jgi:hypothetical protein
MIVGIERNRAGTEGWCLSAHTRTRTRTRTDITLPRSLSALSIRSRRYRVAEIAQRSN